MATAALCSTMLLVLQGGTLVEDFEAPIGDRWEFRNGPEFPGAQGAFERLPDAAAQGEYGGRLSFDFTEGGAYVEAAITMPPEVDARAVEMTLRKMSGNTLAIRFTDSEGQTFQKSFNVPAGVWQRVRIYPDRWAVTWGGAGDGVFRGRLTRVSLVVDHSGGATTGWVDFDEVVALSGADRGADGAVVTQCTVTRFDDWGFWCEGEAGEMRREGGRLEYDFSRSTAAVFASDVTVLGDPQTVRLRVQSDGSGHTVELVLGSHFQTFATTLGTLDRPGEVVFEAPIGDMSTWSHSGGENDGVKRLPLRALQVMVRRVPGRESRGTIELLALEAETRLPSAADALFPVARPQNGAVALSVASLATEDLNAEVRTEFVDWEGCRLGSDLQTVALPAGGSVELVVPYGGEPRPFVEARISIAARGQRTATASCALVAPFPEEPASGLDPSSPWGMGLYLYRYSLAPESLAEMNRAAALAAAAGVKWSREEMQWHRIETAKGVFDWEFYDRVIDTATRHGISVYGLIAYWSGWTEPYTERGIQDYCDFAQALVRRYGDRIKHWEIWNEPNIFFWSGPKELYFELLDRAYEAIKQVDPDATVFGCSTAGIDTGFVERTIEAGARFDGLTIHPYRGELDDLAFVDELRATAELVSRDGVKRPVWITEMGWSTQIGGTSERDQARYLARCYIDAVASGVVGSMGWYNFQEDGTNPYYNEHCFGVVRRDLTPKPAYRALGAVCRTLAGSVPVGPPEVDDRGVLTATFRDGDRWITACWSIRGVRAVNVGPGVSVMNAMHEPVEPLSWGDERVVAMAPNTPIIIEAVGDRPSVQPSQLAVETSSSVARPGDAVTISLPALQGGQDLAVEWSLPAGVLVEPQGESTWRLIVPQDATSGAIEAIASIRVEGGKITLPIAVEVIPWVLEV